MKLIAALARVLVLLNWSQCLLVNAYPWHPFTNDGLNQPTEHLRLEFHLRQNVDSDLFYSRIDQWLETFKIPKKKIKRYQEDTKKSKPAGAYVSINKNKANRILAARFKWVASYDFEDRCFTELSNLDHVLHPLWGWLTNDYFVPQDILNVVEAIHITGEIERRWPWGSRTRVTLWWVMMPPRGSKAKVKQYAQSCYLATKRFLQDA